MPRQRQSQKQSQKQKQKQSQRGGRTRRSKPKGKGLSDWNKKVMEIYHSMKKSDPSVRLSDAMKKASKLKKAGKL